MTNLLETFEKKQIKKLTSNKRIPAFRSGDLVKVTVKIVEGERTRSQAFEGVCIARKNNGSNSKFTVRKVSHGEGVERVFPLFSPIINSIEVIRKGDVKRAKLYYLRDRTGRRARISSRDRGDEADQYELVRDIESKPTKREETETSKDDTTSSQNNNIKEEINNTADSAEVEEIVAKEENKPSDEKLESSAVKAEKTEDETKR